MTHEGFDSMNEYEQFAEESEADMRDSCDEYRNSISELRGPAQLEVVYTRITETELAGLRRDRERLEFFRDRIADSRIDTDDDGCLWLHLYDVLEPDTRKVTKLMGPFKTFYDLIDNAMEAMK